MTVDLSWADTAFSSVLGVPSWQVANYVLNGLFAVLGILVAKNVVSLYHCTQRWLLVSKPGRPGRVSTTGLAAPKYNIPYLRSLFRDRKQLLLAAMVVFIAPSFSAISLLLLDFKLRDYSYTVTGVALDIANTLPSAADNTWLPPWRTNPADEWSSLSSLVLSTTLASLAHTLPIGICLYGFSCTIPSPTDTIGRLNIIQFAGTTFMGTSTYGYSATINGYWGYSIPGPGHQPFALASIRSVERRAYGQSSNFACEPLHFTNVSTPVTVTGAQIVEPGPALMRHDIFTDGPCFTRNSTFLVEEADQAARFDVQACRTNTELQLQFVVVQPQGGVEAYNCSSAVMEGYARGVQTSSNVVSVSPPSESVTPLPASVLRQYADNLNVYFGLSSYPLSNNTVQVPAGSSRVQGDWASALRYNWPIRYPTQEDRPPVYTFDGRNFTAAYANALVTSLGTFFATGLFDSDTELVDGVHDIHDLVEKQVVRLGAPVVVGAPFLSVIVILLFAHVALFWLCRQELLALDIGDGVEMLLKVGVRDQAMPKVAELCAPAYDSDVELVSSLPLLHRRNVGGGDIDGNGKGMDASVTGSSTGGLSRSTSYS